jgi:hypothetical protein
MDPTVTFVLALLSLAVAAGGLFLGVLNYRRARPPKPRWVGEVKIMTDAEGERQVTASFVNRGRGVARDVTFEPGDEVGLMRVMATRKTTHAEFGDQLDIRLGYAPDVEGDGSFLLTWSEEPHLHKRRTERLTYTLSAAVDPNSRRGRRLQ